MTASLACASSPFSLVMLHKNDTVAKFRKFTVFCNFNLFRRTVEG